MKAAPTARPTLKSKKRGGIYACAVLLYALLTIVMTLHIYDLGAYTDFQRHAAWVQNLWVEGSFLGFVRSIPYCGWHALVRFALYLDIPINVATALVTALFNACTAAVCLFYLNRILGSYLHPAAIAAIGMIVLMVAAVWLPCFNQEIYKGQGSPNIWHSPTYDAVRPVSVLITIILFDSIKNRLHSFSMQKAFILLLLILLSIILKPSFFAILLPSMILYAVIDFCWHRDIGFVLKLLLPVMLPTIIAAILFVQLFFMNDTPNTTGDIGISPVLFQNRLSPNPLVSDLLLMAFPIYAVVVCREEIFHRDSPYLLIVLLLFMGFCEYSFIAETGTRAADGNFAWGLMSAVFIAWLYLLPLFIKTGSSGKMRRVVKYVGFALVAWHLLSGICYCCYLLFIGTSQC